MIFSRLLANFCILPVMAFSLPHALAQNAPSPVFVAEAKRTSFTNKVEALGTLRSNESVEIYSTITERITSIHFDDNQRVSKGDILFQLDTSQEEAALTEEKVRKKEAKRQVTRLRKLQRKDLTSQSVLDEQLKELNVSTARISAIQARINEHQIQAPFDGVVGLRNISVGALASPNSGVLTTVDDISVMKLDFSIPEVFLSTLESGIAIEAISRSYPDKVFKGQIASVNSRIDPVTRTVLARAFIPNKDGALKAGMLIKVTLIKKERQALVVPEEAIVTAGQEKYVMVINEGEKNIAEKQIVEIGLRRKGEVEILNGLVAGQKVVIHGAMRLRPGSEVSIKAMEKNNETLTGLLDQSKN